MRYLLFSVGHRRLCLPVAEVARVLTPDGLQQAYGAPDYIKGLLNYLGQWVPVIDLCLLVDGQACRSAMSTRMIIIQLTADDESRRYIGVIAETVDETMQVADDEFSENGLAVTDQAYFGDITDQDNALIYRLHASQLLPDSIRQLIRLEPVDE